jgi:hypothetical protein
VHVAPRKLDLAGGQRLFGAAVHRQDRVAGAGSPGPCTGPEEVLARKAEAWLQHQAVLGAAERQREPPHQQQALTTRILHAPRAGALNTIPGNPTHPRVSAVLGPPAGPEQHRGLAHVGVKAGGMRVQAVKQPRCPARQAHLAHAFRAHAGAVRQRVEQSGRRIAVQISFDLRVVAEAVVDQLADGHLVGGRDPEKPRGERFAVDRGGVQRPAVRRPHASSRSNWRRRSLGPV